LKKAGSSQGAADDSQLSGDDKMGIPSYDPRQNAQRSGYMQRGFAERYDTYRPTPPPALLDLLCQFAQTSSPALVVDLGSGTGLSTAVWAGRAQQVVGIEPLAAMRRVAEARYHDSNISFHDACAQQTMLPAGAADLVTCAQSLHWMDPVSTFAEAARILRPGGVFATYDYDLLPTVQWEAEQAFVTFIAEVRQLRRAHTVPAGIQEWEKSDHLSRLQASRRFRYVKELLLHHTEPCTAERWVGFALTLREVAPVIELGLDEAALALEAFRRVADRTLGRRGLPWYVSYRVRVGVK
jgi:SAM-dependent methyltransferase